MTNNTSGREAQDHKITIDNPKLCAIESQPEAEGNYHAHRKQYCLQSVRNRLQRFRVHFVSTSELDFYLTVQYVNKYVLSISNRVHYLSGRDIAYNRAFENSRTISGSIFDLLSVKSVWLLSCKLFLLTSNEGADFVVLLK